MDLWEIISKTYVPRFLITDVRSNDLGTVVSVVHPSSEPYNARDSMLVLVV